MPRSKNRGKKYRPINSVKRMATLARFWALESMAKNDDGSNRWAGNVDFDTSQVLLKTPVPWLVDIRVFCRDESGNEYHDHQTLKAPDCLLNDIVEAYTQAKEEVLASVNDKHVFDYGWLAMPCRKKIDDRSIDLDKEWHKVRQYESAEVIRRMEKAL